MKTLLIILGILAATGTAATIPILGRISDLEDEIEGIHE